MPRNLTKINRALPDRAWQLQTAKARFSELFRLALTTGPQLITRQGKDAVVMLRVEQLTGGPLQTNQELGAILPGISVDGLGARLGTG